MAVQERTRKPKPTKTKTAPAVEAPTSRTAEDQAQLDLTDELLAEIDAALGENLAMAQEFIASYIQKGGE